MQIFGLENIEIGSLTKKGILVKSNVNNVNNGNLTMSQQSRQTYRQRCSPILLVSNGCSIKSSFKNS